MTSYEDFKKVDIRVGTIVSAEKVEGSEKLLKLMVDVGEEKHRQIISGIAKYFPDPTVLLDMQTTFVINLEPRSLMGLESQGMLFAASDEEGIALLRPSHFLKPGSQTK